jgi:hypothetical protein
MLEALFDQTEQQLTMWYQSLRKGETLPSDLDINQIHSSLITLYEACTYEEQVLFGNPLPSIPNNRFEQIQKLVNPKFQKPQKKQKTIKSKPKSSFTKNTSKSSPFPDTKSPLPTPTILNFIDLSNSMSPNTKIQKQIEEIQKTEAGQNAAISTVESSQQNESKPIIFESPISKQSQHPGTGRLPLPTKKRRTSKIISSGPSDIAAGQTKPRRRLDWTEEEHSIFVKLIQETTDPNFAHIAQVLNRTMKQVRDHFYSYRRSVSRGLPPKTRKITQRNTDFTAPPNLEL